MYTLTEKGLEALHAWARTPVTFTPVKSEVLVRMLIADLVGEEVTRAGAASLRADIAELFETLDESAASAELLPHRRAYLLLTIGFLRRLLELYLEWIDEIERELEGGKRSAGSPTRAKPRSGASRGSARRGRGSGTPA